MSETDIWKPSLERFFSERASHLHGDITYQDLCYVSGREPRLWSEPGLYEDMVESISTLIQASPRSEVLEVGCAAGFIARGITPGVSRYVGVDLSRAALSVARRLRIPNARFRHADGAKLPFRPGSFDAAFCYDVLTNLPSFDAAAPIITDMVRVVRSGGRVLVGSIPDAAVQGPFEERVKEVVGALDRKFGTLAPRPVDPEPDSLLARVKRRFSRTERIVPQILCYYFRREDFVALGNVLGCETRISEIHARNPYAKFRFNALYTVPAR